MVWSSPVLLCSAMLYGDADDGSPTPPLSSSVFELLQLNVVPPFNAHPHTHTLERSPLPIGLLLRMRMLCNCFICSLA